MRRNTTVQLHEDFYVYKNDMYELYQRIEGEWQCIGRYRKQSDAVERYTDRKMLLWPVATPEEVFERRRDIVLRAVQRFNEAKKEGSHE